MKIQAVVAGLAMAAVVCVPGVVQAAPMTSDNISFGAPVHAFFGKPHMVTLNLRNDSAEAMTVKAGDKEMTIAPGKLQTVKLAAGEKIVAVTASPNHAAGDLLATVDPVMDSGTIGLK